jgi:hypothetical protein
MKKPDNYDSTQAATGGEFGRGLPAGNYLCKIQSAFESTTKSGKSQLNILFDIADGEYKDYYKKQYAKKAEKDINANWPGVYRQLTEGNSTQYFKGMVTAINESNGFEWDFDEAKLKGKVFLGMFGLEEFLKKDGTIGTTTRLRWIRSTKTDKSTLPVLDIKKLQNKASVMDGFSVPPPTDDDVPNF